MVDQNLLDFVKANAKQLFGNQFWEARFLFKVDVGSKPEKAERRILVLSKFRLFFISGKVPAKLHIETSYPLLSVSEISMYSNPNELYLTVDGRRVYIRLVDENIINAHDFSIQLLTAFKHYYPDCDLHRFIELSPSSLYATYAQLPSAKPTLPCNGFRRTYASLCDFYKQTFRDEIVWDVEKIYSLHNNTILRLDDFSHLSSKDLIPLISTLQFSAWFSGISSETLKLTNEITDAILLVLKKSQRIRDLILKNCGLKNEFLQAAAQALAFNSTIPLTTLDLSGNTFDDHKIVGQFANSLSALNSALRIVIFDDCSLNVKAVNVLCDKLQVNQNRSNQGQFQLSSISFAENLLKDDVSELCHLVCHSTFLTSLNLSGTGLPLDKMWIALKSCCSSLNTLKLSGCSFSCRKTAKDLNLLTSVKDFFSCAVALKFVDLSECVLPAEILKYILLGLVCNQECDDIFLDLSRSFSDRQCISHLETCAPDLSSVSQLILRDCALEQDSVSLLPSIALMKKLRRLDIGGNNFVQSKKQQTKQLKCILMELVKLISEENSTLLELNLSDCRIGMSMCVLLNALGVAPSLKILDISGNDIQNFGARLLGKALQVNSSLEILHLDKNQITHEGYADIVHSLKHNSSLLSVPYPVHDASESLKICKDKTENVLSELDSMLRRNNSNQGFNNCVEASSWIYETHSKLVLGNVEEELNQTASKTTRLLGEWNFEESNDVIVAQKLLQDVESVKDMLDQLISLADSGEFVTRHLEAVSKTMVREINENLTNSVSSFLNFTSSQNYAACQNPEFINNVRSNCMQKIKELNVELAIQDFSRALRQRYNSIQFNLATVVNEKVCQELIKSLNSVNKILGKAKKSSLNSLNNEKPSTSTTPSGKKKFKFFSKRPLSIIEGQGVPNFAELVDEQVHEYFRERNLDGSTDNFDNNSIEIINKEELSNSWTNDLAAGDGVQPLVHVQKGRARPPRSQKTTKSALYKPSTGQTLDEGIDQFFGQNSPHEAVQIKSTNAKNSPSTTTTSWSTPVSCSSSSALSSDYLTSKVSNNSSPSSNETHSQSKTDSSNAADLIIRRKSMASPIVEKRPILPKSEFEPHQTLVTMATASSGDEPEGSCSSASFNSVEKAINVSNVNIVFINNSPNSPEKIFGDGAGEGGPPMGAIGADEFVIVSPSLDQNGSGDGVKELQNGAHSSSTPRDKTKEFYKPERPPLPSRPPPARPRVKEQNKDETPKVIMRDKSELSSPGGTNSSLADQRRSVLEMKKVFESSKNGPIQVAAAHVSMMPVGSVSPTTAPDRPVPPPRVRCTNKVGPDE